MAMLRSEPKLLPYEPRPRARASKAESERPIWEIILEMADSHPSTELDKIPHDGALNHDHYLYGAPRKPVE